MATELEAVESGQPIPLEPGIYPAVVQAVAPVEGKLYGPQVQLYLKTEEVGDDGEPIILWAWASMKLSTLSKLYGWVSNITGSPPEIGKRFVIEEMLIGKPCRVQIIEETKDGATRVRVGDILPARNRSTAVPKATPAPEPAPPVEEPDPPATDTGTCSECEADVDFFTPQGIAYCADHLPRAVEAN